MDQEDQYADERDIRILSELDYNSIIEECNNNDQIFHLCNDNRLWDLVTDRLIRSNRAKKSKANTVLSNSIYSGYYQIVASIFRRKLYVISEDDPAPLFSLRKALDFLVKTITNVGSECDDLTSYDKTYLEVLKYGSELFSYATKYDNKTPLFHVALNTKDALFRATLDVIRGQLISIMVDLLDSLRLRKKGVDPKKKTPWKTYTMSLPKAKSLLPLIYNRLALFEEELDGEEFLNFLTHFHYAMLAGGTSSLFICYHKSRFYQDNAQELPILPSQFKASKGPIQRINFTPIIQGDILIELMNEGLINPNETDVDVLTTSKTSDFKIKNQAQLKSYISKTEHKPGRTKTKKARRPKPSIEGELKEGYEPIDDEEDPIWDEINDIQGNVNKRTFDIGNRDIIMEFEVDGNRRRIYLNTNTELLLNSILTGNKRNISGQTMLAEYLDDLVTAQIDPGSLVLYERI